MTDFESLVAASAPWLSAMFGISAAVFAERAFRAASKAEPPDRWRGSDLTYSAFDESKETQERMGRDTMRARASALQSVATFLGAGAAVEAAAASQRSVFSEILVALGVGLALIPSGLRWIHASSEIAYTKAWYVSLSWAHGRKWISTQDQALEDAAFAKDHPREAAILKRRRFDSGTGEGGIRTDTG